MKRKWLGFIGAVILNGAWVPGWAAAGGAARLAGLTPVSEACLGRYVPRLDEHKSTAAVLLAGKVFRDGIGVEVSSSLVYALKGGYERLEIKAGSGPGGRISTRIRLCGSRFTATADCSTWAASGATVMRRKL